MFNSKEQEFHIICVICILWRRIHLWELKVAEINISGAVCELRFFMKLTISHCYKKVLILSFSTDVFIVFLRVGMNFGQNTNVNFLAIQVWKHRHQHWKFWVFRKSFKQEIYRQYSTDRHRNIKNDCHFWILRLKNFMIHHY